MFFGIWLKGGAQGWACTTGRPPRCDEGPFMPAGSGSRPSSASSGAVESECQHEAEADDFDGYADEDGTNDINDIDDIDDTFQTMVWASMRVIVIVGIVVIVVIALIPRRAPTQLHTSGSAASAFRPLQ